MHSLAPIRVIVMLGTCLVACRPQTPVQQHAQSIPTMPGPTHAAPAAGRAALNDGCVRCHSMQAQEWAGSQHQTAHTDPDYQRALASEREGFCQTCHAPEAAPAAEPANAEGTIGVACVTCHLPHGTDEVLAVPDPRAAGSTHAVTRLAAFADVDACAGCHEFAFPRNPGLAMQATISEHARSEFADVACADCHMPWVGSGTERHRSHAFAASRDPQMLRDALVVDAQRDGGIVSLKLAPGRIGHAFPTGDLFRRLWVDAEAIDDEGDTFAYDGRALGRRFTRSGARMIADDRPGARAEQDGIVEVTFDLGDEATALPIRWRIVHQRVEQPLEGDEAELFGETLVDAGELPATRGTP